MLMTPRFYVDHPVDADHLVLPAPEAHHLTHVLRAQAGQEVTLFDGSGYEYTARITTIDRSRVEVQVLDRRQVSRELARSLILAVALPKGDRQRWLVEKCVELGVTALVPLNTRRGVAQPTAKTITRLERSVVEACKQCGRNRLMEISSAQDLSDYLQHAPAGALRLIADPQGGVPLSQILPVVTEQLVQLAVGPEGGFTGEETDLARGNGWTAVNLGHRILRVETAAIALVSAIALSD